MTLRFTQELTRKHAILGALVLVGAVLTGVVASTAFGTGSVAGPWTWSAGDKNVVMGSPKSNPLSMEIDVPGDLNSRAGHFRFESGDGNYEFEHSDATPYTRLNSYFVGTPTRTPIVIGGNDGQDILSLLVEGKAGQANDLQDWSSGGKVKTAIDGHGDLRIGAVTLSTRIVNGSVELIAHLPNGTTQVLAFGSPPG